MVLDVREGKPSASGLQRIALCPGSWLAERALPEETSGAAEAGTRLHGHMELGSLPEDAEEAEACGWCREMELLMVEQHLGCYGKNLTPLREQRWWDAQRVFSGQADVVWCREGEALVLDYKFGRVPVTVAANNLQLAGLALLAFDNVPGLDVAYAGILQPWVSRYVPRVVRYQRADVPQLRRYLYGVVQAALVPGARRVPGEQQCRYCRAKVDCPACMAMVRSATDGPSSADLSQGLSTPRQQLSEAASCWSEWAPEKKAEALKVAQLAKRWAEAVERRAKADLKDGAEIPGWKMGSGRKSFKISDATGAFCHLNGLIGLSGEAFAGCCTVSISALDKVVHGLLAAQAPEGVKQKVKDSAAWLRTALEDFGCESVSEGTLKQD